MEAFIIIAAVVALGAVYVLLPTALDAYQRYASPRTVICPRTNEHVIVEVDAVQAALSATAGRPDVQIKGCSELRPQQKCDGWCMGQIDRERQRPVAA